MTSAPASPLPEYLRWIKEGSPEDLDDETAAPRYSVTFVEVAAVEAVVEELPSVTGTGGLRRRVSVVTVRARACTGL
jgi:hypothetical protein